MPSDSRVDVFISYTPYNVILSYCIAADISDGRQYLYLVPSFDTSAANSLLEFVGAGDVFDKTERLPGQFDGSDKRDKKEQILNIPRNIRHIRNQLAELELRRTFAAVDSKEVVQGIMSDSPHNVAIEDGTNAYKDGDTGWRSIPGPVWINKLFHRLLCGFWWEPVSVYGTSSAIDEVRLLFPELRRPELQHFPAKGIDAGPLYDLVESPAIQKYLSAYGVSNESFDNIDTLLLLPHSQVFEHSAEYETVLRSVHQCLQEHPQNVALKGHPREDEKATVIRELEAECETLPAQIPAEVAYALLRDQIEVVVAGRSTSAYTAAWLCPDATVLSYEPLVDEKFSEDSLYSMFRAVDIQPITELSGFEKQLQ